LTTTPEGRKQSYIARGEQNEAPLGEDVPGGQSKHVDAPLISEYDPGGQLQQLALGLELYCPTGQSEHDEAPNEEVVPTGQSAHADDPAVTVYDPGRQ
jgi:hypothetical protein